MLISHLQHGHLNAIARDYADGDLVRRHRHAEAQFLYAAGGLMRLVSADGAWVIPPSRGVWIPPLVEHEIVMCGAVQMRTLFIAVDAAPVSLERCCVLAVTPLLRELILRAVDLGPPRADEHRAGLVAQLMLAEIAALPHMPLHLPMPRDRRLKVICMALLQTPGHSFTLEHWGLQVGASARTLARLFNQELDMGFHEWRQQLRLTEAMPRLLAGESVRDVAQALGYGDARTFSAMFRRLLGETPSQYLKQLGMTAR